MVLEVSAMKPALWVVVEFYSDFHNQDGRVLLDLWGGGLYCPTHFEVFVKNRQNSKVKTNVGQTGG